MREKDTFSCNLGFPVLFKLRSYAHQAFILDAPWRISNQQKGIELMPNGLLFLLGMVFYLGCVLLFYKLFGKNGLFIFAVFSTIFANIAVCKSMNIFGIATTGGNEIYASTFLVTDILSEKYGKKEASRAVLYSFTVLILWLVSTQLILLFTPNESDFVNGSLRVLFGVVPRVTLASIVGFFCSQNLDVFLYHFIWNKTGGGKGGLWIRNNGSTLISQAVDTVLFVTIAFWGVYPTSIFISILWTTYVFKAIVALVDTPFMYAARRIRPLSFPEA